MTTEVKGDGPQRCPSVSEIRPPEVDGQLSCLLVSPHPFYRHYTALPGDPAKFWTWDDKHPDYPCTSPNCPGDARYAPPGKGHYSGCRASLQFRVIRVCCGQVHTEGVVCPDGLVMCCLCFDRVAIEKLNLTSDGIPEDVCRTCAEKERR